MAVPVRDAILVEHAALAHFRDDPLDDATLHVEGESGLIRIERCERSAVAAAARALQKVSPEGHHEGPVHVAAFRHEGELRVGRQPMPMAEPVHAHASRVRGTRNRAAHGPRQVRWRIRASAGRPVRLRKPPRPGRRIGARATPGRPLPPCGRSPRRMRRGPVRARRGSARRTTPCSPAPACCRAISTPPPSSGLLAGRLPACGGAAAAARPPPRRELTRKPDATTLGPAPRLRAFERMTPGQRHRRFRSRSAGPPHDH